MSQSFIFYIFGATHIVGNMEERFSSTELFLLHNGSMASVHLGFALCQNLPIL